MAVYAAQRSGTIWALADFFPSGDDLHFTKPQNFHGSNGPFWWISSGNVFLAVLL